MGGADERIRCGLVLGAGGTAGGEFIRGALEALHDHTGFRPDHADVLVGTSIGAIIAARIGSTAAEDGVFRRVERLATVPSRPGPASTGIAAVRQLGGRLLSPVAPTGRTDSFEWLSGISPDAHAQVVSVRRLPPSRRVAALTGGDEDAREVAASCAVPFGAESVDIDGAAHIDGALWSVTNADLAPPNELDLLVVIAPLVTTRRGTVVSATARHQLRAELRPWARARKPVLVLAPSPEEYGRRHDRAAHRLDGYRSVPTD